MGITYRRRPPLEELELGSTADGFNVEAYALAEQGQAGYVEKIDVDVVLEHVDNLLIKSQRRLE